MIDVDVQEQDQENDVEVELEDIEDEVEKVFRNEESTSEDEPIDGAQVDEDYRNNDEDTTKKEILYSNR